MAQIALVTLDSSLLYPELADRLAAEGAGQCWCCPQEAAAAAPGAYPHGAIDDCLDGDDRHGWTGFQRVWNDHEGVWLNACSA